MDNIGLDIKSKEITNVLHVDGLKENILSVAQIDDKVNVIMFRSTRCKIIEEDTGKFLS